MLYPTDKPFRYPKGYNKTHEEYATEQLRKALIRLQRAEEPNFNVVVAIRYIEDALKLVTR